MAIYFLLFLINNHSKIALDFFAHNLLYIDQMRIEKKGSFFFLFFGNPIELIIETEGKKYSTLEICR